jgi:hypothetical protein
MLIAAAQPKSFTFAPLSDPRAAAVVDAMLKWTPEGGPELLPLVVAIGTYMASLRQRPPRNQLLAQLFQIADVIDAGLAESEPAVPLTRFAVAQAVIAVYDAVEAVADPLAARGFFEQQRIAS